MFIKTRQTRDFIEIRVSSADGIVTETIFNDSESEIKELLSLLTDLTYDLGKIIGAEIETKIDYKPRL